MSIGDLFKSAKQREQEEKKATKAAKENAELTIYKEKRYLEKNIKQLAEERLKLSKQYSQLDESSREAASVLAAFKVKTKSWEKHKLALDQINSIETHTRGSANTVGALDESVAKILRAIDIVTTPEITGEMSEDEKIRVERNLAVKLGEASYSGGGILEVLASKVSNDEDEISDEKVLSDMRDLLAAKQHKSDREADDKIKDQLKVLDAQIKGLESDTVD